MNKRPNWISEKEAAELLGYKPYTVRIYVKAGKLPINYYTRKGRRYQYDRNDIESFMLNHSTVLA